MLFTANKPTDALSSGNANLGANHLIQLARSSAQKVFELSRQQPELNDSTLTQVFDQTLRKQGEDYQHLRPLIARLANTTIISADATPFEAFELKLYQVFAARHPLISRRNFFGLLGALGASAVTSNHLSGFAANLLTEAAPAKVAPPPFILGFNEPSVLSEVTQQLQRQVLGHVPEQPLGVILRQGVLTYWDKTAKLGLEAFRRESDGVLIGESLSTIPGAIQPSGILSARYPDLVHAHVIGGDLLARPDLKEMFDTLRRAQAITAQLGPSGKLSYSNKLSDLANRTSNVSPEELRTLLKDFEANNEERIFNQYIPSEYVDGLPYRIYLQIQDPYNLRPSQLLILEEPRWDLPRGFDDLMTYRTFLLELPSEPVPATDTQEFERFRTRHFENIDQHFIGTVNLNYSERQERPIGIYVGEGYRPAPIFLPEREASDRHPQWLRTVIQDHLKQALQLN